MAYAQARAQGPGARRSESPQALLLGAEQAGQAVMCVLAELAVSGGDSPSRASAAQLMSIEVALSRQFVNMLNQLVGMLSIAVACCNGRSLFSLLHNYSRGLVRTIGDEWSR